MPAPADACIRVLGGKPEENEIDLTLTGEPDEEDMQLELAHSGGQLSTQRLTINSGARVYICKEGEEGFQFEAAYRAIDNPQER